MLKITCTPEFLADVFTSRSLNCSNLTVVGLPEGARLVSVTPKCVYEAHWSASVEWELLFAHASSPDNVIEDVTLNLSFVGKDC